MTTETETQTETTHRMSEAHRTVRELLTDTHLSPHGLLIWKEMYLAMGDKAEFDDLANLIAALRRSIARAQG